MIDMMTAPTWAQESERVEDGPDGFTVHRRHHEVRPGLALTLSAVDGQAPEVEVLGEYLSLDAARELAAALRAVTVMGRLG